MDGIRRPLVLGLVLIVWTAIEQAPSIWSPLASTTSINKQVMQKAALRTATAAMKTTGPDHTPALPDVWRRTSQNPGSATNYPCPVCTNTFTTSYLYSIFSSISDDSTFNILQLNANGIGNKLTVLGVVMETNKVKVAVIQESKLTSKSNNTCIQNYITVRKDKLMVITEDYLSSFIDRIILCFHQLGHRYSLCGSHGECSILMLS